TFKRLMQTPGSARHNTSKRKFSKINDSEDTNFFWVEFVCYNCISVATSRCTIVNPKSNHHWEFQQKVHSTKFNEKYHVISQKIPCFSDVLLQKSIPLFPFWCLDQLQHLRRRRKVKKQLLQRTISMLRSSRCYTSTAKKLFPTTKNFLAV
ncbi:hypothetical protein CMV_027571, partial [Castanea mollissima]